MSDCDSVTFLLVLADATLAGAKLWAKKSKELSRIALNRNQLEVKLCKARFMSTVATPWEV